MNYEAAVSEIEMIVSRLDGNQLSLQEVIESYRRCLELLNFCRSQLVTIENQIKVLDEDALKPWMSA